MAKKPETKAEEKARAEAEAKVNVEAKAKSKAEAKAQAEAEAAAKIEAEAKTLGIKKTRTSVAGSRVKDKVAEAAKHKKKAISRLAKAIAIKKGQAKEDAEIRDSAATEEEAEAEIKARARKKLLSARLRNSNNQYTREQIRQFKAELHAIATGRWFPPYEGDEGKKIAWKVPKKPTAYDRFMNS